MDFLECRRRGGCGDRRGDRSSREFEQRYGGLEEKVVMDEGNGGDELFPWFGYAAASQ